MPPCLSDYFYIATTIAFTVYAQLMLKWRMGLYGQLPQTMHDKFKFIVHVFMDTWVLSTFAAAFLASLAWMGAMTKFELGHAYPFMSLNFVLVYLLSSMLLNEPITAQRTVGILFIVFGTYIISRS